MNGIQQYRVDGLKPRLENIDAYITSTSGSLISDLSDLETLIVETSGDSLSGRSYLETLTLDTSGDFVSQLATKALLNGDISEDFAANELYGANGVISSGDVINNGELVNYGNVHFSGDLFASTAVFTEWTNKGVGASAGDTYDLDVSNLQKYSKISGATYLITLSNGGEGTYIIKLTSTSTCTVTASGGTIVYPDGETDFTLTAGNTGLFTIIKDGTTHYIVMTEF